MRYDDQLPNADPIRKQDRPFEDLRDQAGNPQVPGKQPYGATARQKGSQDQVNTFENWSSNQTPGGQQHGIQAGKQNDETSRQTQDVDTIVVRGQEHLSEWQARANKDPRNPYGKIDDMITAYNNQRSIEPYQQCW